MAVNNRIWFAPVLWNFSRRYLLARPWQSVLMVLGIALGVAVVVSIDLANASAGRAFELSTETVTGKTTHQVEGGPLGVEDELYVRLKRERVAETAAPVISEYVTSPQLGDRPMQLLGIDPFADAPFRDFFGQTGAGSSRGSSSGSELGALTAFLTRPGAVVISEPVAGRYGLRPGDALELYVGGYRREAFVAGLLVPDSDLNRRGLDGLILADIATAQELTGSLGRLTRIDLILPEEGSEELERIERWLPPEYSLVAAAARAGTVMQMSEAFQVNLSALSLLALVVGLFLIYNTMTFSVVQRRSLFGTLRCLGVTRREVFAMVLGEAFWIGLLGGLLGIALGLVLGQVTVRMVTQTVNDLYFTTTVQSVGIDSYSLIKGGLLGLLATMAAAAVPAWEAASVPPRAALLRSGLETKARRSVGKTALAGAALGVLGGLVFALPTSSLVVGFTGTLLVVVAFALLSSALLVIGMRAVAPLTTRLFGVIGRMAPRSLVNSLSRTAVAVAALMVAVAVIIGVALMIDSFRYTVVVWLQQTLQGDLYVSVPGFTANRSSVTLDPRVVQAANEYPGISRVDLLRAASIDSPAGPISLQATHNPAIGQERIFAALDGTPETVWERMQAGGVLISEPLAHRLKITRPGEEVRLPTQAGGEQSFPVLGIYYDYASSEGTLLMSLNIYRAHWSDPALTALALRLDPGVNPDEVAAGLQDRISGIQQALVRPNQALRQEVLEVFDRTFAITVALRMLATLVAFIGVLNALLLLQLEKQREIGILRALGLTSRQLRRLVMVETGLMGLAAGLLAFPTGYTLAMILVYIINRRSFGWTLQLSIQPQVFAQALAVAMIAALLAAIYPAVKLGRMAAAEVIRYE